MKVAQWSLALVLAVAVAAVPPASARADGDGCDGKGLGKPVYGIVFENDVPIEMRDGTVLLANVYRPKAAGRFPVIMASAPYNRNEYWADGGPLGDYANNGVSELCGDDAYLRFELPNPGFWVRRGYAVAHYNTRGTFGSEGYFSVLDKQEAQDYYDAIEWAGTRSWSSGNVGLLGISYYAVNQYAVAALKPPHLKAIVPWEGLSDPYRDSFYRGGILSAFAFFWGALAAGQAATDHTQAEPFLANILSRPLHDEWWAGKTPDLTKIDVPMLAVGHWSDVDLHLRGSTEAFSASRNRHKKLFVHAGTHWGYAYGPEGVREAKRFLDYWLKGERTGVAAEPPVKVHVRTGSDTYYTRYARSWPLPQARWSRFYLTPPSTPMSAGGLTPQRPQDSGAVQTSSGAKPRPLHHTVGSEVLPDGVTFTTPQLKRDLEVTGPLKARLWVSATAADFDIVAELHDMDEQGREVRFGYVHAGEPDQPVSRGWLRVSHRHQDAGASKRYRPFHTHREMQPLAPGDVVPVDVEIWPTSMVLKKGHQLQLSIRHNNVVRQGFKGMSRAPQQVPSAFQPNPFQEIGMPTSTNTIHTGADRASYLLLPIIPGARRAG